MHLLRTFIVAVVGLIIVKVLFNVVDRIEKKKRNSKINGLIFENELAKRPKESFSVTSLGKWKFFAFSLVGKTCADIRLVLFWPTHTHSAIHLWAPQDLQLKIEKSTKFQHKICMKILWKIQCNADIGPFSKWKRKYRKNI